jgi:hypothetical protein
MYMEKTQDRYIPMLYIKDNKTKREYEINLVSLLLIGFSYPISFLFYGISVALVFDIIGFKPDTVILFLVVAYAFELLLTLVNKLSPVKILFAGFASLILLPILIKIAKTENITVTARDFRDLFGVIYKSPFNSIKKLATGWEGNVFSI